MRTRPTLPIFFALSIAALSATTTARAGGLPVCDGKHKRAANPYGSVLSAGLLPTLAKEGAADLMEAPQALNDVVKAQHVSRLQLRAAFAPCGKARA